MSVPVSGEHHERAVKAAASSACPDPDHGDVSLTIDAYHRSLAEQGVVLVDLREVTDYLRAPRIGSAALFWADALERRFGSVSE